MPGMVDSDRIIWKYTSSNNISIILVENTGGENEYSGIVDSDKTVWKYTSK